MKRIDRIQQLEDFGIIPLTGESDAHLYRILCDVTKKGKAIIERTLGIQITPAENWNEGRPGDPHVGSFLLPMEFLPPLAVFCLLSHTQVTEVWLLMDGSVVGFGVEDDKKDYGKYFEGQIRKVFYALPNDRNLHQFTGRTV